MAQSTNQFYTLIAGEALGDRVRVKLSGGKAVKAGATDRYIGITQGTAAADGDEIAVRLRNGLGTVEVTAAGAITAGNTCYDAANGKVAASGSQIFGIALEAATADGDQIEVLPLPDEVTPPDDSVTGDKIADDAVSAEHLDDGILPTHRIVAAGVHTWAGGAAATDSIAVTGLEATDVVLVNIQARGSGNPTSVIGTNDAGNDQIDLVMDQNGEDDVTKIGYAVLRAVS